MHKQPFFIIGCVRSGTTLLRDCLRLHPYLACPEETNIFRWTHPFDSVAHERLLKESKILHHHWSLDGFSVDEVFNMIEASKDRKEFFEKYGASYAEKKGVSLPLVRLFDKTPQHIYGVFLLKSFYPDSKCIHIHRNPLNVVASLIEGKVMPSHSIKGAVNYWLESMMLMEQFKKLYNNDLLEISYECFVREPFSFLRQAVIHVDEDPDMLRTADVDVHQEPDKYHAILNQNTIDEIKGRCEPYFSRYGYG